MEKGDNVKMSESFKFIDKNRFAEGSWEYETYIQTHIDHIEEFGNCEGIVIGFPFEGDNTTVDVRWQPSNLKYGYDVENLEKI